MNRRLRRLTPFRFIAALLVVFFHFGAGAWPFEQDSWPLALVQRGNLAVSFFFCLSGFVMALVYRPDNRALDARSYWLARLGRLYPVYLLAIAIGLMKWPAPADEIALNLFLLQSWIPGYALTVNPPGWSLSVEAFFYALFPLISRFLMPRFFQRAVLFGVILWISTQAIVGYLRMHNFDAYPSKSYDFIFYFSIFHLNEFFIGAVSGRILTNHQITGRKNITTHLLILICSIGLVYFFYRSLFAIGLYPILDDGLLAPIFAASFTFITLITTKYTYILDNPLAILLGESSYVLYIIQSPVRGWFNAMLYVYEITVTPTVSLFIYIFLLIFLSIALHLYFEKPIRALIKRKTYRFS